MFTWSLEPPKRVLVSAFRGPASVPVVVFYVTSLLSTLLASVKQKPQRPEYPTTWYLPKAIIPAPGTETQLTLSLGTLDTFAKLDACLELTCWRPLMNLASSTVAELLSAAMTAQIANLLSEDQRLASGMFLELQSTPK